MPGGDGTGPLGMGPITGRGAGFCTGNMGAGFRGRGIGFGCGRGFGRGFARFGAGLFGRPGVAAVDEKTLLTEQARAIEETLTVIKQRLENLDRSEK